MHIIKLVDSICRDSVDTQYMIIQKAPRPFYNGVFCMAMPFPKFLCFMQIMGCFKVSAEAHSDLWCCIPFCQTKAKVLPMSLPACWRSPRNWLKIVKNSMGYSWDWFKSPFPWVSHGTDLSHQNPWDTHGSILSPYSWLKLLWWMCTMHSITDGTILSQVTKECAPIVSHHQSKSLLITQSRSENDFKWSHE